MPDSSPAGWYPDPFGRHERRYWAGNEWTEHVVTRGHQAINPPGDERRASSASIPQTPAGWHPDPYGRSERRFWNGSQWTDHVMLHSRPGVDPAVENSPAQATNTARARADWYPDPFGRDERRYWDGNQWTDRVASGGRQEINAPMDPSAASTPGRASRKIERQVSKSSSSDGQAGGGTLFTEQLLIINQKAKLFGSTLGYAVYNQTGHQLGTVQEIRRDLATKLSDSLRGRTDSNRTHRFQVVDMNSRILLAMTRPETGWSSMKGKLVIEGPGGAPVGEIVHESFGVGGSIASAAHAGISNVSAIAQVGLGGLTGMVAGTALTGVQKRMTSAVKGLDKVGHARFGLEAGGQRLGSIHAESTRQWDFKVRDPTGTEIARITKTWAGWAKERFTKADNYVVEMHRPLQDPLRSLVIAAALAIDVELKQQGDQTSRSSTWGTRRYK